MFLINETKFPLSFFFFETSFFSHGNQFPCITPIFNVNLIFRVSLAYLEWVPSNVRRKLESNWEESNWFMHFPCPLQLVQQQLSAEHNMSSPTPLSYPATFFVMLCIVRQLEAIEKPKGKQAESCVACVGQGRGRTPFDTRPSAPAPRLSANHKDIISSIS